MVGRAMRASGCIRTVPSVYTRPPAEGVARVSRPSYARADVSAKVIQSDPIGADATRPHKAARPDKTGHPYARADVKGLREPSGP